MASHTLGIQPAQNHSACPILLSSVVQGDRSVMQSWDFQTMSPREAFVPEPDRQVLQFVATFWGVWDANPISLVGSACNTPGRGRSSCLPPTGLQVPPPMGDGLDWPCQILNTLPCGAQFHGGWEGFSELGHSKCETLGDYYPGSG